VKILSLLEGVVIGMIITSLILLGVFWWVEIRPYQSTYEGLGMDNCLNLSIEDAAKCARDKTEPFFKYNITNIDTDLSLQQLKDWGGVCWHWANYYCDIGDELGYYTYQPIFTYSEDSRHQICIWSGGDGYVILDQLAVRYVGLGTSEVK